MPEPIFREVQYLSGWPLLIVAGVGVLVPALIVALVRVSTQGKDRRIVVAVGKVVAAIPFLICATILLLFGRMTTEVTGSEVSVRYGWLTGHSEAIPVADVRAEEVVRPIPFADYGGSGIRSRGADDRLRSLAGDGGTRLRLEGGRSVLIGSHHPEELAKAIAQARRESRKGP